MWKYFCKMKLILVLLISLFFLKCNSSSSYAKDRGNDFGDIGSISLDTSVGIELSISRVSAGIYRGRIITGCKFAKCYGADKVDDSSSTFLFFTNQRLKDEFYGKDHSIDSAYLFLRNKNYSIQTFNGDKERFTNYGRIKIRAGFIFGLSLEFNFLELADFVLGFVGLDFLDDDHNQYLEELIQKRKMRISKERKDK